MFLLYFIFLFLFLFVFCTHLYSTAFHATLLDLLPILAVQANTNEFVPLYGQRVSSRAPLGFVTSTEPCQQRRQRSKIVVCHLEKESIRILISNVYISSKATFKNKAIEGSERQKIVRTFKTYNREIKRKLLRLVTTLNRTDTVLAWIL